MNAGIEGDLFEARLAQVRAALPAWDVDAVLITSASNRRWLSGFTGSAGRLLISAEAAVLATDSRYWEQAADQSPAFSLFNERRQRQEMAEFLALAGGRRIGIEANHVTLAALAGLEKWPEFEWVPLADTVENWRQVKSDQEVALIRRAAVITDLAMNRVPELAHPGVSEEELAWKLEQVIREAGAEALAFPTIVASGPNAALPHHDPGARSMQAGDALIVDMGARVSGYMSDCTRTFFLGESPDERFWNVYDVVLAAHGAAMAAIHPGARAQDIDAAARDLITAAGHGDHFGHGLGHGVGLEVHEGPTLSQRAGEATLAAGMVCTVEPGIYLPGWGGVRTEDLVLISAGEATSISHAAKSPAINL